MAYKALYRRYRPTNFDEVVGQKYIIQTIKNSIMNDKIAHAYLFSGPRGIGKTTIARIVAKAINCKELVSGNPCNNCENCQAINEASAIDVIEIDAASNNGVDEMRSLLEKVNFLPATFTYKVYIIDEVHMLSLSAFNALLKTLEEPPVHAVFILATTEPHKVPSTVLSRCQRFDFKPIDVNEIVQQLTKVKDLENINISVEALNVIAEAAEGGMRDALSILDQVSALTNEEITAEDVNNVTGRVSDAALINVLTQINDGQISNALDAINDILNTGKEVSVLIRALLSLCRDIIIYQNVKDVENDRLIFNNFDFIKLAQNIKRNKLFKYVDVLNDIQNKIKHTNSPKIYLEVGVVKMVSSEPTQHMSNNAEPADLSEVYDKIYQLETQVKNLISTKDQEGLGEFKDFTKSKLEFLEEMVSRFSVPPRDLEERIESLEEDNRVELLEKRFNEFEKQGIPSVTTTEEPNENIQRIEKLENEINNLAAQEALNELTNKLNALKNELNIYITNETLEERLNILKNSVLSSVSTTTITTDEFNSLDKHYDEEIPTIIDETPIENVESFNLELNDDFFNTPDDSYQQASELDKVKENYLTLLDKFVNLEKEVNIQKQDITEIVKQIEETKEQVANIPTSSIDDSVIEELENKIASIKEYSVKVGARTTALEESFKNLKHSEPENKPIIQKRNQPFETPLREEQQVLEQTITPTETQKLEPELKENEVDDTAKVYDIRIIENILHQSRDRKNMEDKERINSVWYRLPSLVPQALSGIATSLSEGKVVVNGGNYLIIVYQKAAICNHLMKSDIHYQAKQVLRTTLQREYDFVALPVNTWHEKSNEYKGQYHMGIKFPTLTPIKNPELKVINVAKENFQTASSRNLDKAKEIFGQSLIREVK